MDIANEETGTCKSDGVVSAIIIVFVTVCEDYNYILIPFSQIVAV